MFEAKNDINALPKIKILHIIFSNHSVIKSDFNNKIRANNSKHLDIQINLDLHMENKIEIELQLVYPPTEACGVCSMWYMEENLQN